MPDEKRPESVGEIIVKFVLGAIVVVVVLFGIVALTCGGMILMSS
jgi:hypothetical protein